MAHTTHKITAALRRPQRCKLTELQVRVVAETRIAEGVRDWKVVVCRTYRAYTLGKSTDNENPDGVCVAEMMVTCWVKESLVAVNSVIVDRYFRRRGVGTKLYLAVLRDFGQLRTNLSEISPGARRIWRKLMKTHRYVSVPDTKEIILWEK